jgi:hypothetical protein
MAGELFGTAYVNYLHTSTEKTETQDFSSVNDHDRKRMKKRSDRSLDPSRA